MNKTFIKNMNLYFNECKDLSNRPTKKYNFIMFDESKQNYFVTNSYSFIRLNTNTKKEKNKINDIIEVFGLTNNGGITQTIANMNDTQLNNNYCLPFKKVSEIQDNDIVKEDNKKYIKLNDILFDYNKIKHITNLIGGDGSIFTSESEKNFISITGANGYAFLLGCKVY